MTERDDTRRAGTDVEDAQHRLDEPYAGPPPVEMPPAEPAVGRAAEPRVESAAGATTSVPSGETPVATAVGLRRPRGPRRARLQLRHVDPWSMLKFSLVLAVALFVVWMVAVGVLYGVLDRLDVFDKVNDTINEINGTDDEMITPQIVLAASAVIGAVNIVLFTALATIGSFIYNLCADMVGGLEVTLSERD